MAEGISGMIAVDKKGARILFINPSTFEIEAELTGFQKTVHELLVIPETGYAYVPIFGDGIHGNNPHPGHTLHVIDLRKRKVAADIDVSPYVAPHTVRLCADGLIYVTCENSAVVAIIDPKTNKVIGAIESGSTNGHRLAITDDGQRMYVDNEEDATVSVIDVPNRKLLGKIKTPQAIAGVAVSGDGRTVIAVSDEQPMIFVIDTASGSVMREIKLEGVAKPAQIARFSTDDRLLVVSSLHSGAVSLIDAPSFDKQTAVTVGAEPMDFAFRGDELYVGCQGDGTIHIIDVAQRRAKGSFPAGTGCESIGFF